MMDLVYLFVIMIGALLVRDYWRKHMRRSSIGHNTAAGVPVFTVKGRGSTLTVFEDRVDMHPSGVLGVVDLGAGTRQFRYRSITSIEFRQSDRVGLKGFMRFVLPGSVDRTDSVLDTLSRLEKGRDIGDPNKFYFDSADNEKMLRVKAYVERRIEECQAPQAGPVAVQPAASSIADELTKLAALRSQGLLSEDDFAAAKTKLLGRL